MMRRRSMEWVRGGVLACAAVAAGATGSIAERDFSYGEFPLGERGDARARHVVEQRGKPLRNIDTVHTLHASAFGAVPDDGRDDLPALRALFAEAVARGRTRVVIEPGSAARAPNCGTAIRNRGSSASPAAGG